MDYAENQKGKGFSRQAIPFCNSITALLRDRTIAHYFVMTAIVCAEDVSRRARPFSGFSPHLSDNIIMRFVFCAK